MQILKALKKEWGTLLMNITGNKIINIQALLSAKSCHLNVISINKTVNR